MITPLDIQNKEFAKAVRGYKEEEVDGFLDLITMDLERLITENAGLKTEVARLTADLQRYQGSEGAVLETLEAAKALMGDISASAEKRAEILLKNAELDAELIQREARESVERLTEETISLQSRFTEFRTKYKSLLESELERFYTLSAELFTQYGAPAMDMTLAGEQPISKTRIIPKAFEDGDMSKTMVNIRLDDE